MAEQSGVFLLHGDDILEGMQPAQFVSEDVFQTLLERFPDLLVGDLVDPLSPRKWALVKREKTVSTGDLGAALWSVDHVFLDQDGIPTLVEIKRQSDSRIRREVVGQMLDYAANCTSYWNIDDIRTEFEKTCLDSRKTANEVLQHLLGSDADAEAFWRRVKDNLESANIRLLFVADVIPPELRRVVEFLNAQMKQVEVLAIELRQFKSKDVRAIVPTVYGQTQAAAQKRAAGRTWDETSLFDKLSKSVDAKALDIGKHIYEWMRNGGKRKVEFGTGQLDGSVYPVLTPSGEKINPVYLSSNGRIYVQFGALKNKPVFGPIEVRRALMQRMNEIAGVNFGEIDLDKYPAIALATIAKDPQGDARIMTALQWIDEQLSKYE
jgi:hypothetical protein